MTKKQAASSIGLHWEKEAWAAGYKTIAGVDEAGRGPLAGPVVAAAVYVDPEFLEAEEKRFFCGLTDSKKLTAKQRDSFFSFLTTSPEIQYGIGLVGVEKIDEINILQATYLAMHQAVSGISSTEIDLALVDGLRGPSLPCKARFIVKGDAQSLLIAAASVVAKVTRDKLMQELDSLYPEYGFAKHKGYGTAKHLAALQKFGATPQHRKSFAPVAMVVSPPQAPSKSLLI